MGLLQLLLEHWLLIIGVSFILVAVFLLVAGGYPYEARPSLITKTELNFYRVLRGAVGKHAHIFCMVRLADVITVKPGLRGHRKMSALGKIAQKHLDFVLTDKQMNIICAIELHDSSHANKDRQKRDDFVRDVMQKAKVPLIEIKASRAYDVSLLKKALFEISPELYIETELDMINKPSNV
tara:strand:- start:4667 stop:5209 length:543 start_codon:yes stop_codon:yes gene_type:complete